MLSARPATVGTSNRRRSGISTWKASRIRDASLSCQKRMAAEVEEIVVDTYQFNVEELGPDLRQQLFCRSAGRYERLVQFGS